MKLRDKQLTVYVIDAAGVGKFVSVSDFRPVEEKGFISGFRLSYFNIYLHWMLCVLLTSYFICVHCYSLYLLGNITNSSLTSSETTTYDFYINFE